MNYPEASKKLQSLQKTFVLLAFEFEFAVLVLTLLSKVFEV